MRTSLLQGPLLKEGDIVELEIEEIGILRNSIGPLSVTKQELEKEYMASWLEDSGE